MYRNEELKREFNFVIRGNKYRGPINAILGLTDEHTTNFVVFNINLIIWVYLYVGSL